MKRMTTSLFLLSSTLGFANPSTTMDLKSSESTFEDNVFSYSNDIENDGELLASEEQFVTVAHTNMGMDINLSVIINSNRIEQIHIKGKNYDDTFNTADLGAGVVLLKIGGDLVKLQSDNWNPLTGGDINMDFLQDKKTGKWLRATFQAAYNPAKKVALFQVQNGAPCEISYLDFEFSKNSLGLPKGVNSITGTCL